jgi:hypothetical protein
VQRGLQQTASLRCHLSTNRVSGFARGWRALRAQLEVDVKAILIVYCPDCAERDLGEDPR